jgi:hypothetical protein
MIFTVCSIHRYYLGYEMKYWIGLQCSIYGAEGRFIECLVGKREGKRPLGRPRHIGTQILELILKLGWKGVEWIAVTDAEDSTNCCENGDEIWSSLK